MDLLEFLRWTVPDGYLYTVHERFRADAKGGKGDKFLVHVAHDNRGSVRRWINKYEAEPEQNHNIWFALAAFREKLITNSYGKDRPRRTQANVATLRSFWADIDCKGEPGTYGSKREALEALISYVRDGAIPNPSLIVDSGNGIHVYWCMNEDVERDVWQPVADALRALLVEIGLRIDPGITIDCARIMRPPETMNRKDKSNPKPVSVLRQAAVYEFSDFREFIMTAAPAHTASVNGVLDAASVSPALMALDGALGDTGKPQGVFLMEQIAGRCQQIASMVETNGAGVREPLWKATLLLAAACDDGLDWAHTLSSGHASYDLSDTNTKFDQQVAKLDQRVCGPTTCETFAAENPSGCQGCPLRGTIKSPIILGAQGSAMPHGYCVRHGETMRLLSDPSTGGVEYVPCFPGWLKNVIYYRDERGIPHLAGTLVHGPRSEEIHVNLNLTKLGSSPSVAAPHLISQSILVSPSSTKNTQALMQTWALQLRNTQPRGTAAPIGTMGWSADLKCFDVGQMRMTAAGPVDTPVSDAALVAPYIPHGSRQVWDKAMAVMSQSSPHLQAITAVSFGAPLAKIARLDGYLFCFRSGQTGTGKTTALRLGASVWGRPKVTAFSLNDTRLAISNRMGMAPNLPAYWDEVRTHGRDAAVENTLQFLFQSTEGREKARLTADVRQQKQGEWQTLVCAATNESIYDLIDAVKGLNPSAALARTLEVEMPDLRALDSPELSAVADNYGHAWQPYIRYVLQHHERIAEQLQALEAQIGGQLPGTEFRFFRKALACVVVGAHTANKAGVANFNVAGVSRILIAAARGVSTEVQALRGANDTPVSTLREWLINNQSGWLITGVSTGAPTVYPVAGRAMTAHFNLLTNRMIMSTEQFREFAKWAGHGATVMSKQLAPALVREKAIPGEGTALSMGYVQCRTMSIDDLDMADAVRRYCADYVAMRSRL